MVQLRKIKSKNKKAALELSIGTIVILVIAMSMLILGLILVRTIFTGAKYNVETMNEKVKGEINKLFVQDQKAVLYLPNREAEVKQGKPFGVAFGIQNVGSTDEFQWRVVAIADDNLQKKCGFRDEDDALDWITTGGQNFRGVNIPSGDKYTDIIRFNIQKGSVSDISQCIVRFQLEIFKGGGHNKDDAYTTESFDVVVSG